MNKLVTAVKKEFSSWKPLELLWLAIASATILALSLYWKDNWVGITSALTGIWCVIFTGKGKRSSFVFGLVNVLCYAYVAMQAKFYGEVMLNLLYYVPMCVVGWFVWTQHMDDDTGEVIKTKLSKKAGAATYTLTLIAIAVYGYILQTMGGNLPYIDSMSTIVAIVAQILSVKRLTEQWVLWIVVDAVSVVMWGINFARGGESIATLAMWGVYLINAIVMYVKWRKEAR